ncbi:coiled-coil domain-containing protein 134-like isoform X2 [Ischnura elegans]|uniref:coiled-coil domain-containing protein 134-like isoform X2 n=1 Tax=Ischnura elegans TaxID=197161 RepID=UPI001ED8A585|nr:coiled-coil domain-containing protein 134-like isoform X2 [Ischnura elegans]
MGRHIVQRLYRRRRVEQLAAVKSLMELPEYEKQYKMVIMIAEKVYNVIESSRVTLESSGYIPGAQFPKDENVRDALSNILENTALLGDVLLHLPDITHAILAYNYEWTVMFRWSIGFCNETLLMDSKTVKMINLVAQEMNITDRDPSYVNPYRKDVKLEKRASDVEVKTSKKKKKKDKRKGPALSSPRVDL